MNIALWVCQSVLAALFMFSGIQKSTRSERELVASGQTGVEGLSLALIRFIGISEVLGAIGLVVPWLTGMMMILTPTAATCLGLLMIPAAVIHYRRSERKTVLLNMFILLVCAFVAYGRFM